MYGDAAQPTGAFAWIIGGIVVIGVLQKFGVGLVSLLTMALLPCLQSLSMRLP
jgi:hypothetical protein